jgi:pimeloyl-ACP methyl ester carboxylesterase
LPDNRLEEIWGSAAWQDTPVLLLYGDEDQYVPDFVDKAAMVNKWSKIHHSPSNRRAVQMSRFEILPYANHELGDRRYHTSNPLLKK